MTVLHEISPQFKSLGKRQLMFCKVCETHTLHITPFFGYPFHCVAIHGGQVLCDGCHTFVNDVAKVVVDAHGNYDCFCALCCKPDSPEKERRLAQRRAQAADAEDKPLDLDDPASVARAFGASAYRAK